MLIALNKYEQANETVEWNWNDGCFMVEPTAIALTAIDKSQTVSFSSSTLNVHLNENEAFERTTPE